MALIHISGKTYEIVQENRNGWNAEAFRDRYSEVLERYDFIVGDWGYSQLRLKGFFRDNHQKATKDSNLSSISDYINEYCNFGCAYFILEKTLSTKKEPEDFDLDLDEQAPRLEAADLLAAAEAGYSGSAEEDGGSNEETPAIVYEKPNRTYRSEARQGSPNRRNENRQFEQNEGEAQQGSSGGQKTHEHRRENRSDNRNGRRDHRKGQRGKRPVPSAVSETAAASASTETKRVNQKDAERS